MVKISKRGKIAGIVGLALFIIGIFGWLSVINEGPSAIELTESAQWGLLVGMFFFFEALGVGLLVVAAIKKHVPMLVCGVAAIIGSCVVILMDLYHPALAWRLLLAARVTSPMFLDVLFSSLCIIFGAALAIVLSKGKGGMVVKVLQILTVLVAVFFPLGTTQLCLTLTGQTGWSTFDFAEFFAGAAACGAAGMCFFDMKHGRKALLAMLAVLLVLALGQAGFLLYGTDAMHSTLTAREVVTGKYAPLFWTTNIVFVALPMALCLVKKVDVRIAAGLTVAGVACAKYLFAIKGNIFPYMHLDNVQVQLLNYASGMPVTNYMPNMGEWVAAIGVIGLVVAIFVIVTPLLTNRKAAEQE